MSLIGSAHPAEQSERVLYNGRIRTLEVERRAGSLPTAVAIRGDRIVAVGQDAEVMAGLSSSAVRIDLRGRTVLPGFNDNHTHAFATGVFYQEPILWGLSCEQIVEIVREAVAKAGPGEVIKGAAWDYPTCPSPHREMLDAVAPNHPVFLTQYSNHAAWVNTLQLEKMGIDARTPDPVGGQIVRDANGEPTGVLRDAAMGDAQFKNYTRILMSPEQHRAALERALQLFREVGLTSVQDNTWEPLTQRLLNHYRRRNLLSARFTCWTYLEMTLNSMLMRLVGTDPLMVRRGPVKLFADGAFSSRTAWLDAPYADAPENEGESVYTSSQLTSILIRSARKKQQVAIHAIGDRAVHEVLNVVEKVAARYSQVRSLRWRLEHIQLIRAEDIPRMKALGMVACVQPFALSTPAKDVTLLGLERARRAYPYKSLLEAGIPIAFGSDVPAEVDFAPMLGIQYAVTRQDRVGVYQPLQPLERFTVEEAVRAYTMGSAYAEGMEEEKGSIRVGKLADLVVLAEDPFEVEPRRLSEVRVELTLMGGDVVYERSSGPKY